MEAVIEILGSTFGVLLPFLVVLGVVIFVHEFGHYIVGRWCGIEAETFSLGFFGEMVGWTDKRGTRWRISWVPLGGFVMFKGDASAASTTDFDAIAELSPEERRHTLAGAPLWAKASMVAAGPMANFLLTIVLMALLGVFVGRPTGAPVLGEVTAGGQGAASGFVAGDRIVSVDSAPIASFAGFTEAMLAQEGRELPVVIERGGVEQTLQASFARPARVGGVIRGRPAARACLEAGDEIIAVDGATIENFPQLQRAVESAGGAALNLTYLRKGETREVELTPEITETPDPTTGEVTRRMMIGVMADFKFGVAPELESMGPIEAVGLGFRWIGRVATGTFGYVRAMVVSEADGSSLSGPLGIAQASGDAAQSGIANFVGFIATVSVAIGLLNLFPIPLLDGGHLLFYAVEAVRGKPLGERSETAANLIGLLAIVSLIVFSTFNDLGKVDVC